MDQEQIKCWEQWEKSYQRLRDEQEQGRAEYEQYAAFCQAKGRPEPQLDTWLAAWALGRQRFGEMF